MPSLHALDQGTNFEQRLALVGRALFWERLLLDIRLRALSLAKGRGLLLILLFFRFSGIVHDD